MLFKQRTFASAIALLGCLYCFSAPMTAQAEDCTGTLPAANCTLDEDTTAPLAIQQNVVLTVSAGGLAPGTLTIGHTIDGFASISKGDIETAGNGGTIIQEADIGSTHSITRMTVNAGDMWYLSNDADLILEGLSNITIDGGILGIGPDSALSTISAGILGGAGTDILDFVSGGTSMGTTGIIGRAGERIDLGAGDDRFVYYQSAGSTINADRIQMGDGDDVMKLLGTATSSVFAGDFVGSNSGREFLVFESGSSSIFGSSASQFFFGGGDDEIDFDSGTGVAGGRINAMSVDMGAGNDLINIADNATLAFASNGSLTMGGGTDQIVFTSGGFIDGRDASIDLGDGDDVIQFNSVSFIDGAAGLDVSGGTFTTGAGNDTLLFYSNAVGLNAASGTTINLGTGNDRILFASDVGGTITSAEGAGFLDVDGGDGVDVIYFGSGADTFFGDNTAGGNIINVERIDFGSGGTFTYYGDIDSQAALIGFSSMSFFGANTDILAYISGDDSAQNVLFASGATFTGTADMNEGNDGFTFSSAQLEGTINFDAGVNYFSAGAGTLITGTVNAGSVNDTLGFTSGETTVRGDILGFTSALVYTSGVLNIETTTGFAVDIDGTGTARFGSAGSTSDTYTLANTIDGVDLHIIGDTVNTNNINLGGTNTLQGLNIGQGATLYVEGTSAILMGDGAAGGIEGDLAVDGTLRLSPNATITADAYDESSDGTFTFEIDRSGGVTSIGTINFDVAGQTVDFSSASGSGDSFRFVLGPTSSLLESDTLAFISVGAGGTITGPEAANVLGSTILYDITVTDADADPENLEIVITQNETIEGLSDTDNNLTLANVLLTTDLLNSNDEGITAIREALLNTSNAEEFNEVLTTVLPIVDRSAHDAVTNVNNRTFGLINQRLAMLRKDRDGNTGISTGDLAEELEAWWQFYGQSADQDEKNTIPGYELTTYGFAAGVDKEMFEDTFFGLSFAWGESSANSKGPGDSDTEVDTYQLSLYGDHDFGRAYINGAFTYGYNDIYTAKTSAAGTRTANFHVNHYSARGEAGFTFLSGKTRIIPSIMGNYTYFSPESYTEEGGGAQTVTFDSIKVMEAGLGLDLQWLLHNGESSYFVPEVNLGYRYDFADEAVVSTTQFQAGGPIFEITGADPSEQAFDFGMGVTYFSEEAWELLFRYDMEYRQDYLSHAGMVRASYKFLH